MKDKSQLTTVVITVPLQERKLDEARREFSEIIKTVVANESACHGINLLVDPANPRRLLLIEYWDSKDAFTGPHMQTEHMQQFVQRAQGFTDGPPDFAFWQTIASV